VRFIDPVQYFVSSHDGHDDIQEDRGYLIAFFREYPPGFRAIRSFKDIITARQELLEDFSIYQFVFNNQDYLLFFISKYRLSLYISIR
jgi:hypothetical protein